MKSIPCAHDWQGVGIGTDRKRLCVARVGIAELSGKQEGLPDFLVQLNVEPFAFGLAEIVSELQSAVAELNALLNALPIYLENTCSQLKGTEKPIFRP